MITSSQFFSPQAMAAKMKANRGAVIILRLILRLCSHDWLIAYDARLTRAVTRPDQRRRLGRKDTGIQLVSNHFGNASVEREVEG